MTKAKTTPAQLSLAFRSAFEGPAVDDGTMSASEFAPALLGMSALVETSAELYFGMPAAVSLRVNANFRRGSFDFGLMVSATAAVGQQVLTNISVSDLRLLLSGIGLIGRNAKSLLRLMLQTGDAPISAIEPSRPGLVNIHINGDNNHVTIGNVDQRVARMMTSETIREAVPQLVSPVSKPGISSLRLGTAKRPTLRLNKSDVSKLKIPAALSVELADGVSQTALEVLSPNFVDGNKWRVAQGGDPFWVRLLDQDFLSAVDRGERTFAKGDYLIVELRTRAYSTDAGMAVERDVLRVLDHKTRTRQLRLV